MPNPQPPFGAAETDNALALIELALAEDLRDAGDITSEALIPPGARGGGALIVRRGGVISGLPIAHILAERFGLTIDQGAFQDGDLACAGQTIGHVSGPMGALLAFERTTLNFVQRLSGIATLTARFVAAVEGTRARIQDTRKTTPGWRVLEKYAVRCGGGANHRMGLYDAVLIKDNHLEFLTQQSDPIGVALGRARAGVKPGTIVEIEITSLPQFDRALECAPDIILLDNMSTTAMAEAARRRNSNAPGVLLEASGGVNLDTVRAIAETGVDRISVGALTHSASALDIALDFVPESRSLLE